MPRVEVFSAFVAAALLTLVIIGVQPEIFAQDATPAPAATHPFVGAWIVDTDTTIDVSYPALAVVTEDGTYIESHPDLGVGVGTWEATGEHTADLTIVYRAPADFGAPVGLITAHATVEVAGDGNRWEAPYRFEEVSLDGTVVFTGEGHARAVRVGAKAVAGLATPEAATPVPLRLLGDRLVGAQHRPWRAGGEANAQPW